MQSNNRQNNFSASQNKINNRNIYNEISHLLSTSHKDVNSKKLMLIRIIKMKADFLIYNNL